MGDNFDCPRNARTSPSLASKGRVGFQLTVHSNHPTQQKGSARPRVGAPTFVVPTLSPHQIPDRSPHQHQKKAPALRGGRALPGGTACLVPGLTTSQSAGSASMRTPPALNHQMKFPPAFSRLTSAKLPSHKINKSPHVRTPDFSPKSPRTTPKKICTNFTFRPLAHVQTLHSAPKTLKNPPRSPRPSQPPAQPPPRPLPGPATPPQCRQKASAHHRSCAPDGHR